MDDNGEGPSQQRQEEHLDEPSIGRRCSGDRGGLSPEALRQACMAVPKAELHLHLEVPPHPTPPHDPQEGRSCVGSGKGTLEAAMELELARRNAVEVPYASVDEATAARERLGGLSAFLDLYYRGACASTAVRRPHTADAVHCATSGSRVLCKEEDYYELMRGYLRRAEAHGVAHAEVFVDPQAHLARGVALSALFGGIRRAIGEQSGHLSCFLIVCFLRERSAHEARALLDDLLPYIQ